jgi:hypothetical protein
MNLHEPRSIPNPNDSELQKKMVATIIELDKLSITF